MRSVLSILLMVFVSTACAQNEECTLELNLAGQEYKTLAMGVVDQNDKAVMIYGVSGDGEKWLFKYSSAVYDSSQHVYLVGITKGDKPETRSLILKIPGVDYDKNSIFKHNFDKNSTIICRYDTTKPVLKEDYTEEPDIIDYFTVTDNTDTELELSQINPIRYIEERRLGELEELITKHPDSHYLIQAVVNTGCIFVNSGECKGGRIDRIILVDLYSLFSDENKKSFWGMRLKECIEYGE